MMREIVKNKQIVFGTAVIIFMFCVAIFAPFIAAQDPYQLNLSPEERLQPPSKEHWFGTDDLGRDLFSRMVYGARISLSVGFIALGFINLDIEKLFTGSFQGSGSGEIHCHTGCASPVDS